MNKEAMIADAIELMKEKIVGFNSTDSIVSSTGFNVDDNNDYLHDSWTEDSAREYLSYLVNNLTQIIEELRGISNPNMDFRDFIEYLGSQGLLSVPMDTLNESVQPALQIRWNRFLQLKNGSFMVSGSPNDGGDCKDSSGNLVHDFELLYRSDYILLQMLAFSHVCQATNKYDKFFRTIVKQPETFNYFMNESMVSDNYCGKFDLSELLTYIHEVEFLDNKPMYKVTLNETPLDSDDYPRDRAFGVIALHKDFIGFRLFGDNTWKVIYFPEYKYPKSHKYYTKEEYYSIIWKKFVWVLLSHNAITATPQFLYPHRRYRNESGDQRKIIYIDIECFQSCTDIVSNMSEYNDYIDDLLHRMVKVEF